MDRYEIYNLIRELARSQGLYSRILEEVEVNPDILEELEGLNLQDAVDLILLIEG